MKRNRLLAILLAGFSVGIVRADSACNTDDCSTSCCSVDLAADCTKYTGKTIWSDIAPGQSGTFLRHALICDKKMNFRENGWGSMFQAVLFGGKTTDKGREELGHWFGLKGKRCMVVAQDGAALLGNPANQRLRDIDADHFNIEVNGDDFSSTICFCPEQKLIGGLLTWQQSLYCDDHGMSRWWLEINAPIVRVKHSMGLEETAVLGGQVVTQVGLDSAPRVANMVDAFKQEAMKYGKIDAGCKMEHSELANIEFKLGYNSVATECCNYGSYIGFAAKSTHERTAEYMFEPIAGQESWAIMWGSDLNIKVRDWCESSLKFAMHANARYWFENDSIRSFDLKDKSWSRYMAVYKNFDEARAAFDQENSRSGSFGINHLTACAKVKPGYQFNLNTALVYEGCSFVFELGHTMYARQAEEVCVDLIEGPVLKAFNGDGSFNDARTINEDRDASLLVFSQANYNLVKIKQQDIDCQSAAHTGVLGHTIYGSLGYNWDLCYPTVLAIGGAYDLARSNSQMHRWNVFGKIAVSF